MILNKNIFGCYASITQPYQDDDQKTKDLYVEQGKIFRNYIWGENSLCETLKKLKNEDYGKDLLLALFQFYVNPLPIEVLNLKEIGGYRKKEKSISISMVINNENFFSKTAKERDAFMKEEIISKINLLGEFVKQKKLDTNIEKLKADLILLLY